MAEALRSRGPLDGFALPRSERFAMGLAPRASRFILRGSAEVAARVGESFGATPCQSPRRAGEAGGRTALWLGPDEWLLIAEGELSGVVCRDLETALGDLPHSLVDISQRQIGLELTGAAVARVLSAGCPLDLDERSFAIGDATRTMLAKAEVVLWRRGPLRFHLEVWRSFADYAVAFLSEAAQRAPPR